ncbi:MAG: tRNA threonylcarbamoyladenosine dehydratase [Selenomonadaceae bacterium]|nr:tRNA threonylcarbamoyladenosine dehydratase [Selenomonadaceae bacterium]MBR4695417.1 tRNA threonylcarbamoyladenosine dehydratase [Selenomonadaceae bacterium]
MEGRFSRTELLLGKEGLDRLSRSTVAVFGIGGVGSFVVEGLARAGVGHLVLVDHDTVSITNINRQLHAMTETLGRKKTEVMKERVLSIHPEAVVDVLDGFYLPDREEEFFCCPYDYVVDAIDTVAGKVSLVLECRKRQIPIISSMGAGNKLDPTKFEVADIYATSVDPLARVMRRKLREHQVQALKVVYSKEEPAAIPPGAGCHGTKRPVPGSVSFVPSVAGMILAGEVVKALAGGL